MRSRRSELREKARLRDSEKERNSFSAKFVVVLRKTIDVLSIDRFCLARIRLEGSQKVFSLQKMPFKTLRVCDCRLTHQCFRNHRRHARIVLQQRHIRRLAFTAR